MCKDHLLSNREMDENDKLSLNFNYGTAQHNHIFKKPASSIQPSVAGSNHECLLKFFLSERASGAGNPSEYCSGTGSLALLKSFPASGHDSTVATSTYAT